MRIFPRREGNMNCVFDAPGYGRKTAIAERLGHGIDVNGNIGTARRQRTFYPFKLDAGMWYVSLIFPEVRERDELHQWFVWYIATVTNPYSQPLKPITVSVPVDGWMKTGYPTSSFTFGDEFGQSAYYSQIVFSSASDPELEPAGIASAYRPPTDSAAHHFSPSGYQSNDSADPLPVPGTGGPAESGNPFDSLPWWSRPS